jgi:hypothetical protein
MQIKKILMKLKYVMPLLFLARSASGQVTITPGAQFSIFSDTKLTLQNTDLINNGDLLVATTSPISFTGNASSFIAGDGVVRFFKLEINKTGNQSVSLRKTISVGSDVLFTAGFLDLNGFNLDLETTGRLVNENENSRVIGVNGGQVISTAILNAPLLENPGNLGAVITSGQNLGAVTVARGHKALPVTGQDNNSILRYYDIVPVNNANLNATLRFNYFDGELNGFNENLLALFSSEDGITWLNRGFSARSATENFVTQTGINSFSRWTLSNGANSPLGVHFVLFNAKCQDGRVLLTWKTAQEQNSDHFNIEKNTDGNHWIVIGTLPAAGNSNIEKTYSFTENNPIERSQYRIAEYDIDGRAQYTSTITSSCSRVERLSARPNPSHDVVFLNIVAGYNSQATIKIFDNKGALVKTQMQSLLQGGNALKIDLRSLSNGVYTLQANWNNGQTIKSLQVIKQ